MWKNYFKIAFRNLTRHRAFSFINIAGLSIGMASCILLFVVVKSELSYDTFQPNYHQIYQVASQTKYADGINYTPGIPFPAIDALRTDLPQVESGALLANFGSQVTIPGEKATNGLDKKFIEDAGFFFCNPQFLQIFHYDFLAGSPKDLSAPNVTILTKSTAEKYFGNWQDALGKNLVFDNAITVKVTGIINDPPGNTDFPIKILASFETVKNSTGKYSYRPDWHLTTSDFQIFMLLPKNISPQQIDRQLVAFSKKYYSNDQKNQKLSFLQPLSMVHFDKRFSNFGDHVTDKSILWTLSLIALFIIVMASINFINLSTAQAILRSKEMGVRKVLGSHRSQLFLQVIFETFLIVFISIILAFCLAALFLPKVREIASIQGALSLIHTQVLFFTLLLAIVITLLSGIYPAFILSGFKPALALKNKISMASIGGISLRKGLVVLQFCISQVLIIGTIIAVTQMSFVKNADLGFNQDAILVINANADSAMRSRFQLYKEKLLALPGVQYVSYCSDVPSSQNNWQTNFGFNHQPDPDYSLDVKFADADYFKTFGLHFVAGRAFVPSDTVNEIVVNETFGKKLNIKSPDDLIGKQMRFGGKGDWKTIVGVVKDFKVNSLKDAINPLAISEAKNQYGLTTIKMLTSNVAKTKASIENLWNQVFPEYAYTSNFFEESINDFYRQDNQLSLLYKIFACIAIIISCLGLYGLISFMAVQRTKEIGVRKVLGASVQQIIFLFSKEFTLLVIIGSLLAIPIAWYMMNNWLQDFVYRIKITPWIFFLAFIISIIIAWLAVGYKSIKAALANPVKSLYSE